MTASQELASAPGPATAAGNRVAAALDALVLQGASGVLEVAGNPSGVIYLDGGEITFAQASWVPDLADRVAEVGGSADRTRALLLDGARNGLDTGALLMQDSSLSRAALKAVLRSVVIDALIVLTMPLGDETSVTQTSFQSAATHWSRGYCRLKATSMRAVAAKRSSGLARCGLAVNTRLELRDLAQPCAVLSKEHWAVAARIDGNLSIRDLARECGIPLYDAIDRVCYLSRKGLCASRGGSDSTAGSPSTAGSSSPGASTVGVSPAGAADPAAAIGAAGPVSGAGLVSGAGTVSGVGLVGDAGPVSGAVASEMTGVRKKSRHEPMVRRVPAAAGATANIIADALRSAAPSPPPTVDQLRRVLEGLRRLT